MSVSRGMAGELDEPVSVERQPKAANGFAGVETPGAEQVEPGLQPKQPEASGEKMFQTIRNFNAGLGETVIMLQRDAMLRHLALADLEWLVLPALAANQILTLRGKVKDKDGQENGPSVPLCLALWAKVSEEVDQKLQAQQKARAPLRLAPQDWTSGEIPWVLLLTGPQELTPKLEDKLRSVLGENLKVFAVEELSSAQVKA